jgi:hypothetical protein
VAATSTPSTKRTTTEPVGGVGTVKPGRVLAVMLSVLLLPLSAVASMSGAPACTVTLTCAVLLPPLPSAMV